MEQKLELYTKEDQKVWNTLFERQLINLKDKSCLDYLDCLDQMKSVLNAESIPDFNNINKWFESTTKWSIEVVPGIIPVDEFFILLADKKFCSSTWLRSWDQLDYLEEPDMFHDIFGHIPLLANPIFSEFTLEVGKVGLTLLDNPKALIELQRLYWFTIEFGLFKENNKIQIYGAGIISSFKESILALSDDVILKPFNIKQIINQEFRTDIPQSLYFYISSFNDLLLAIKNLKQTYYGLGNK